MLKGCLSCAAEWGVIEKHDLNKVKAIKVDNSKVRYLDNFEESKLKFVMRNRNIEIKKATRKRKQVLQST